jgi:hypothetical protein
MQPLAHPSLIGPRPAAFATSFTVEKLQIQNLIKAKEDATQRYESLLVDFSNLHTTEGASEIQRARDDEHDVGKDCTRFDDCFDRHG